MFVSHNVLLVCGIKHTKENRMKTRSLSLFLTLIFVLIVALPVKAQSPTCQLTATVQLNDWLSKLAEKFYGNSLAYPAIVIATNARHAADDTFAAIDDPNIIEPGWQLCIPSPDDAATLLDGVTVAHPTTDVGRLILATTTSTDNSGLLDFILPDFEQKYHADVDVIAVGTGQALKLGQQGDADVLLVHARAKEDAFIRAGYGVNRQDVMYNDFVIVGSPDDPAGIAGMTDVAAAMAKIAETHSPFVSRGDDSGTHTKEKSLWTAAGIEPTGDWYISAGQGMGAVLTLANEQLAYTLSDRATYLARTLEGTDLVVLVEGDPILFNPYGVMAVNPLIHPDVNFDGATAFINWITDPETQQLIATFGEKEFGHPLFTPDSKRWNEWR